MPWIVLPYSIDGLLLSSYESQMYVNETQVLFIVNFILGVIFISSSYLSKLSLRQGHFFLLYVLASPLACFFIFGETIFSIIKAATKKDIISWKDRDYQPCQDG